jgi:hypothetical protein
VILNPPLTSHSGLEADFFVPQQHIVVEPANSAVLNGGPSPAVTAAVADEPQLQRPLAGMSVLLLEDNLILALEAEDLLRFPRNHRIARR